MKKTLLFILIFAIIIILGIFFLAERLLKPIIGELTPEQISKLQTSMPEKTLEGKKIAIIIAFKDFRDEEYFVPKEVLETAGAKITTVSTQTGEAIGADGGEAEVVLLLKDLNVADFDAIIFIGGPGALKYLDNDESYQIAKEAISQKKLLAAICISPVILAKAGVLEGKRATVWSSPLDKTPVRILQDHGVLYQAEPVVVDGKIITGNGPSAAKQFGETIISSLAD